MHILLNGRVQGVSFRAYTLRQAKSIGVVGWVRNLDDGRVEAVLQGTHDRLEKLLSSLKLGPPRAQVADVEVQYIEFNLVFDDFVIEEDGEKPWSEK